MKAREETPEGLIFYKLSDYDRNYGIVGHESVNEIIADRLLTVLDISHVPYQLIYADVLVDGKGLRTWLCASRDFRQRGERKITLEDYYTLNRLPEESPLDFCIRCGWSESIYQMLLLDYLILNRDRHGANIEVLVNRAPGTVRLAPLYDHGVSLFCRCQSEDQLDGEDVMADKPVQCFVGTRSARENLDLIPPGGPARLKPLKEADRRYLLEGLDGIISEKRQALIWEMIWRRWKVYEALRTKG